MRAIKLNTGLSRDSNIASLAPPDMFFSYEVHAHNIPWSTMVHVHIVGERSAFLASGSDPTGDIWSSEWRQERRMLN